MKDFYEYISESTGYTLSFSFNDQDYKFSSENRKNLYTQLIDWLNQIGYNFNRTSLSDTPLTQKEKESLVSSGRYRNDHFHKINKTNTYIIMNSGFTQLMSNIQKFLLDLGVDLNTIKIESNQDILLSNNFSSNEGPGEEGRKYTFIEATQICLQNNNNKPMSGEEIWGEISDIVDTRGETPVATLRSNLSKFSINSSHSKKPKKPIFKIVSERPMKFILLNPEGEIQKDTEGGDYDDEEDYDIKPFPYRSRLSDPSQIEKELRLAQAQPEKTKVQIQSQREKIKSNKLAQEQGKRVENPFIQAICVLGESGAGKSYTISQILKSEGHEFQFIIPTAATTGLLSQYSPRKKEYVPSRLSQMIIEAYANPKILYTAVFDECHKSNVIEMINDELLQAISIRRNDGKRFISLDDDTSEQVFGDVYKKIERGNILIPDNLGFIFISSNPRVIGGNPDFLNRVDLVELTEDKRDEFRTSKDLASMNLKKRDEKLKLIEKLRSM